MNKREAAVYRNWQNTLIELKEALEDAREELARMVEVRGGTPTTALHRNFEWLMLNADAAARGTAMVVFQSYHSFHAQIRARLEIGQALANA